VSARPCVSTNYRTTSIYQPTLVDTTDSVELSEGLEAARNLVLKSRNSILLCEDCLSPWSRSGVKRIFDCACVLPALVLLVPVLLAIVLAVRFTSSGPILFLQKRVGRNGRTFVILKFRTMIHVMDKAHHAVTTAGSKCFTPVGSYLRRWKLDELPQLLNVLWGDMSLVGPRPKLPEHTDSAIRCRPGITGAATVSFAREDVILDSVPEHLLEHYYHAVVLPAKCQIDAEYMARATFLSDLKLLVNTVLRRWDNSVLEAVLSAWSSEENDSILRSPESAVSTPAAVSSRVTLPPIVRRPVPPDQVAAF